MRKCVLSYSMCDTTAYLLDSVWDAFSVAKTTPLHHFIELCDEKSRILFLDYGTNTCYLFFAMRYSVPPSGDSGLETPDAGERAVILRNKFEVFFLIANTHRTVRFEIDLSSFFTTDVSSSEVPGSSVQLSGNLTTPRTHITEIRWFWV